MFTLTPKQEAARQKAKAWYMDKTLRPFVILGMAGSGKSSLVRFIIETIGIDKETNVKYVTYTGKAASVLIKKGNPATTIHKLIYEPIFDKKTHEIKDFIKKEKLDKDIKLLVVDEFYMVPKNIMNDLRSYNVKMICLGDNAQLPPPMGELNDLWLHPDVILDEPLRQALDNPIIYLANQARQHNFLKIGNYGDNVKVIRKNNLDLEYMKNCDQVIAGKNATVKSLNNFYRRNFLGIDKDIWMPQKGEKLICLRNNWKLNCKEGDITTNLVNGLNCILQNDLSMYAGTAHAYADLMPEFFNDCIFKQIPIDLLYFQHGFTTENELYNQENIRKYSLGPIINKRKMLFDGMVNTLNKFTFGYAITCHKSQGSEFDNVFFIFEPFKSNRDDLYWQMLYTGITRAAKSIIIAI